MIETEKHDFVMGDPSGDAPYITYGPDGMVFHNTPELCRDVARRQNEYDRNHGLPLRNPWAEVQENQKATMEP